jgi:hypothetical protein
LLLASNVSFGQADGADTLLREDPNYVPPTSEPLYKAGKRGAPIDFGDQLQLGGMVSFGISKTPAEDGTTATLAGGQLVYRSGVSSWSRFEAGVQFIAGTAGYDAADITVPYLLMARVGYGYAIGSNLYGTFGLGFGTAGGDFDGEIEGVEVSSDDLMTGVASNVEFALNLNPKGTFEFSGGLAYTVIEYALDSVNEFDGSIDKNITIQIPRMFVGVNINI